LSPEDDVMEHEPGKRIFDDFQNPSHAGIVWHLGEVSDPIDYHNNLATYIAFYGINTVLFRSSSTAKAVSYVIDQIRRLA
jgi:hypothetical protein